MRSPSGDQSGVPVAGPPIELSRIQLVPSLSHVQISRLPVRLDSKAIFLPSREYWGANSLAVDEIKWIGAFAAVLLPSALLQLGTPSRQIFKGPLLSDTYAKRRPCLEIAGDIPPL